MGDENLPSSEWNTFVVGGFSRLSVLWKFSHLRAMGEYTHGSIYIYGKPMTPGAGPILILGL
jgi:hypothetical protein